jgi:hypothetical protein
MRRVATRQSANFHPSLNPPRPVVRRPVAQCSNQEFPVARSFAYRPHRCQLDRSDASVGYNYPKKTGDLVANILSFGEGPCEVHTRDTVPCSGAVLLLSHLPTQKGSFDRFPGFQPHGTLTQQDISKENFLPAPSVVSLQKNETDLKEEPMVAAGKCEQGHDQTFSQ